MKKYAAILIIPALLLITSCSQEVATPEQTVKNVVGEPIQQGSSELRKQGFTYTINGNPANAENYPKTAKILKQNPAAGEQEHLGQPIDLTVKEQPIPAATTPPLPPSPDTTDDTTGLAASVDKSLKYNFGDISSYTEILQDNPEMLLGTIASITDDGDGKVLITVQVTYDQTSQEEVQQLANSVYMLTKPDNPSLDTVEVITADKGLYAFSH